MSATPPADAVPAFYNDLDATLAHALDLLAKGVKDRRSALHTFNVATIGRDGAPQVRTVVNRGFDPQARALRFHTDRRSPKIAELEADPRCTVHIYDRWAKIQLRLDTMATVHRDGPVREAAWAATRDFSRICYRVVPAPGDTADLPGEVAFTTGETTDEGEENFVAVTLHVRALEWLYLAHQGHRRARYEWADNGALTRYWRVP